jgi:hypothetical protein
VRLNLDGFAPDLDPATPGVLTDCDNIIPTTEGLSAGKSRADVGAAALGADATGAYVARLLDGTKRLFAGTSAGLYELSSGTWTDRSRGGGYTGTARWRFSMFGNTTLATNRSEPIQAAAASAAFADIATSPDAAVMCTAAGFVMVGDTSDGTYGDSPDRWWCSGIYDHTIWTPAVSTQCATGRLVDAPGRIRAMQALGNDVIAYKDAAMYVGRYVGPPVIWSWQRVPGDIGVSGQESVVVVDTFHYFIGPQDIYVFDGTVPRSIGAPIREWFFSHLNPSYRANIWGVADLPRNLVYFYYPSTASTTGALDSCIVYNIRTQRWGKIDTDLQVPLTYSAGQTTYHGLGTLYSTYHDLPSIPYDSPFWLTDSEAPAVIYTDRKIYTLTGTPGAWTMTTGDFGEEINYSYLSRVTPRFRAAPSSATGTNYYRSTLGDARTEDSSNGISRNRFDFRRSARWHAFRMAGSGAMALNGMDVDIQQDTEE